MNKATVKAAIREARRFIIAAETLVQAWEGGDAFNWTAPKESGACRRASMDLTRKLAEMRKPQ